MSKRRKAEEAKARMILSAILSEFIEATEHPDVVPEDNRAWKMDRRLSFVFGFAGACDAFRAGMDPAAGIEVATASMVEARREVEREGVPR